MAITRMVLDVLKPLEPSVLVLAERLSKLKGVSAVDIDVMELDRKVETVKITLEGRNVGYDKVNAVLEKHGAVIHSLDRVTAGKRLTTPG